jgi:hypothetical protein
MLPSPSPSRWSLTQRHRPADREHGGRVTQACQGPDKKTSKVSRCKPLGTRAKNGRRRCLSERQTESKTGTLDDLFWTRVLALPLVDGSRSLNVLAIVVFASAGSVQHASPTFQILYETLTYAQYSDAPEQDSHNVFCM